jgi:hypothetical protein
MGSRTCFAGVIFGLLAVSAVVHAGQVVVAPDGLTPKAALEHIRAAKAQGNQEAWTVVVKPASMRSRRRSR